MEGRESKDRKQSFRVWYKAPSLQLTVILKWSTEMVADVLCNPLHICLNESTAVFNRANFRSFTNIHVIRKFRKAKLKLFFFCVDIFLKCLKLHDVSNHEVMLFVGS